mmetsp:Transcript_10727/g.28298  ORF Transcript_10727/g.28298 Transcript_10727/m.28298 type:complete len:326 (+) Transcript_10727:231-1208(+)
MRSVDDAAARSVDAVERVSSRPRGICVAPAGGRGRRAPPAAAAAARRELSRAVPADRRHERVWQPRQRARAAAKVRRGVKPDDAHAPARRLRKRLVRYSGLLLPPTGARLRARERLPRARAGSSAGPVRRGSPRGQAGAAPAHQALPGRGSSSAVRRLRSHRSAGRGDDPAWLACRSAAARFMRRDLMPRADAPGLGAQEDRCRPSTCGVCDSGGLLVCLAAPCAFAPTERRDAAPRRPPRGGGGPAASAAAASRHSRSARRLVPRGAGGDQGTSVFALCRVLVPRTRHAGARRRSSIRLSSSDLRRRRATASGPYSSQPTIPPS